MIYGLRENHKYLKVSTHEAVRIFTKVSKEYPGHAIIQGVAIATYCRRNGIHINDLKANLLLADAISQIATAATKQKNHQPVCDEDALEVVEVSCRWAKISLKLSDKACERVLDEYWQHFCELKKSKGYDAALDDSVVFLLVKVFPAQKFFHIIFYGLGKDVDGLETHTH